MQNEIRQELVEEIMDRLKIHSAMTMVKLLVASKSSKKSPTQAAEEMYTDTKDLASEIVDLCVQTVEAGKFANT